MNQTVDSKDIHDFVDGLKIVIRNSWPTQEEFAKGVTSKVNMSNILRKTGGTSYNMRKALAARAGMSVEDVIALARKKSDPQDKTQYSSTGDVEMVPLRRATDVSDVPVGDAGYSAAALMNKATELTASMHVANATHAKAMTALLHTVTSERDRLIELLAQEQAVINALPLAVKMVDREMKVVYANRAMMERFDIMPGDQCRASFCGMCGDISNCIVDQVLKQGQSVRRMTQHTDGVWYTIEAYPLMDNAWTVSKVIVMIGPAKPWFEMLQEMGWTPPADENA